MSARLAERSTGPVLSWPCLELNADFRPLSVYPLSIRTVRHGIEGIVGGSHDAVEAYEGDIGSPSFRLAPPRVVVLKRYVQVFAAPKWCRKNVVLRDRFSCQYCGRKFEARDLTFDHVIPRARGGQTVWENVVMACEACNRLKRDTLPAFSGRKAIAVAGKMRPLKPPRQPTSAELYRAGLEVLPDQIKALFGDYLSASYWNAELEA